jgi:hypothetical protein
MRAPQRGSIATSGIGILASLVQGLYLRRYVVDMRANMVRKAWPPHTSTSRASGGVPIVYKCRTENTRDQALGAWISLYGPQTLYCSDHVRVSTGMGCAVLETCSL